MGKKLSRRLHHFLRPDRSSGRILLGWPFSETRVPVRTTRKLSKPDAAYLAGLVDGEGTVTLVRKHANENRQLGLFVSSTETALLDHVVKLTGVGKVTTKRRYSATHRRSFTYAVYNRQALDLLRQIHAYLRGYKRRRGRLILDQYLNLTPRNGKYSAELLRQRKAFECAVLAVKPE